MGTVMVQEATGASRLVDTGWRVVAIAAAYAVLLLGFDLLSGARPSVRGAAVGLVTGAGFALVLLPLARRLPHGMPTRVVALFVPLYWIFSLGNLVEAYFLTTISHVSLTIGAVFLAIPSLAVSGMIAWLLQADPPRQPVRGIWEALGERPLLARYYHDPAYIARRTSPTPRRRRSSSGSRRRCGASSSCSPSCPCWRWSGAATGPPSSPWAPTSR